MGVSHTDNVEYTLFHVTYEYSVGRFCYSEAVMVSK